MENIANVKLFIESLDGSIDQLKNELNPLLNRPLDELIGVNTHNNIEAISFYNNYLYTLISVIFSYLKVIGIKVEEHPIMKELTRIKSYMKRLKDLETKLKNAESKDEKTAERARQYIVNTLGSNVNGGGAAQPESLSKPAISKDNFKGKHTKFEDKKQTSDDEEQSKPSKKPTQAEANLKKKQKKSRNTKPSSSGRISKPKHKNASK